MIDMATLDDANVIIKNQATQIEDLEKELQATMQLISLLSAEINRQNAEPSYEPAILSTPTIN